jgi:hypothetical protein
VDEHIEVELAPESEADQAGELKERYGLERIRERITCSWGPAICILQILSRMSSARADHPFRWGAGLMCANNAHEALGHPKKTFRSGSGSGCLRQSSSVWTDRESGLIMIRSYPECLRLCYPSFSMVHDRVALSVRMKHFGARGINSGQDPVAVLTRQDRRCSHFFVRKFNHHFSHF